MIPIDDPPFPLSTALLMVSLQLAYDLGEAEACPMITDQAAVMKLVRSYVSAHMLLDALKRQYADLEWRHTQLAMQVAALRISSDHEDEEDGAGGTEPNTHTETVAKNQARGSKETGKQVLLPQGVTLVQPKKPERVL